MAVDEDLAEVSLADLQVDERIIQHLRSEWGIEELFPPQREALPRTGRAQCDAYYSNG